MSMPHHVQLVPAREGAPVTPALGVRIAAGAVFLAALLLLVYVYRRLRVAARVEEAEALLKEEMDALDDPEIGRTRGARRDLTPASRSSPGRPAR